MSQKRKPRLMVMVTGKRVGQIAKGKAAWHFQPSDGVSLAATPSPRLSLKDLTAEIEEALGTQGIQLLELPAMKRAPKKRPKARRKRRKLSAEEWLELERLERKKARFFPRTASIETRNNTFGGRPIGGGLPGLGKRR